MTPSQPSSLEVHPVSAERWADLELLFGENGAFSGCWCMWWRVTRAEFSGHARNKGEGNRRALKALVDAGQVPGLIAYIDGQPVAWCSIGPRESYGSLERSRTLKRIDDRPVWSVVCFFVARPHRGHGLMAPLLEAAVEYAARHGAKIVEGYPWAPSQERRPSGTEAFMGFAQAFSSAGFSEAARVSDQRLVMRRVVGERLTGDSSG